MSKVFSELVHQIVRDDELHARWLNTFSYLEYIGFRKIVKSQWASDVNLSVLMHACEEGRHALRLKKLAIRMGGPGFDSYQPERLLCGEHAEHYFQTLDEVCEKEIARSTSDPRVLARWTYLYVTLLVERRALKVYGDYKEALESLDSSVDLQFLLAEEMAHLERVQLDLKKLDPDLEQRVARLSDLERHLFEDFQVALTRELLIHSSVGDSGRESALSDHGICL
jgi:hypothetical protein